MAPKRLISDENKEFSGSASVSEPQPSTSGFTGITPGEKWMGAEIHGMARVRWQDRRSSSEVAEMYGVSVGLRKKTLRWFRHMKRKDRKVLSKVEEVTVGGQWLCGHDLKGPSEPLSNFRVDALPLKASMEAHACLYSWRENPCHVPVIKAITSQAILASPS
ncbi:hypothetical protein E2C01_022099 [Portunus trituberculatus]|uniref:Uncharacterized protein n=1 Tax=Portunus trituberculatus TaxID=210409 RepID=A0A5B7E6D2_PORTR|nr:hypothetical protein [Portunus trituberculatus]